jgi:hypothetical protein
MRWRRSRRESDEAGERADDRTWSANARPDDKRVRPDLQGHSALPAETGPIWAPDELSVWPVEGGRYGIDAHYHGATGSERAERQVERLARVNLSASVRPHESGGATLRLGPLQHQAAWLALEAFLGRPLELP